MLFIGLTGIGGEEFFDGMKWHKIYEKDGNAYILAMNCYDESKEISVGVDGTWIKLIIGSNAEFENGVLTLNVPPGEMFFLKVTNGSEMGIYKGNVQYSVLQSGEFTVRNAAYAALYNVHTHAKVLVFINGADNLSLNLKAGRNYELKIFSWNEKLHPQTPNVTIR